MPYRPKEYYRMDEKDRGVYNWEKTLVNLAKLHAYVHEYRECRQNLEIMGTFQHRLAKKPDVKFVKLLFDSFPEVLSEIPIVHRTEFFSICVPLKFNFLNRVLTIEDEQVPLFLICNGKANKIQYLSDYQAFQKTEKQLNNEQQLKEEFQ